MLTIALLCTAQTPVQIQAPRIATAAGITAGLTTIPDFEHRYRRGHVTMGGHSNGAREWYDPSLGIFIYADGFNYSNKGEIFDGFQIDWRPSSEVEKNIPKIHLKHSDYGLLTTLKKGMSRKEVEKALGIKLATSSIHRKGLIRYSQNPVNKDNNRYTDWTLDLVFGPKGLAQFTIDCD